LIILSNKSFIISLCHLFGSIVFNLSVSPVDPVVRLITRSNARLFVRLSVNACIYLLKLRRRQKNMTIGKLINCNLCYYRKWKYTFFKHALWKCFIWSHKNLKITRKSF